MKNVLLLITVIAGFAILLSGYKTKIFSGTGLSASITEFDQNIQPDAQTISFEGSLLLEHLSQEHDINAPYLLGVDSKRKNVNSTHNNPEKLFYQLDWKALLYFLFTGDRIDSERTYNN